MVLVVTKDPGAAVAGVDASKLPKTFLVRDDLVGTTVEWTRKRFIVDFRKVQS